MKTITSFLRLGGDEKLLLINTLLLHWKMRILLWLLPFSHIQQRIKKLNNKMQDNATHQFPLKKLIWAVNASSRYTVRSTCLTRALTAQILLARYHYSSTINIGVANDEGEFAAHAWLVHGDEIVLGESDKDYVTLLDLGQG